MARLQLSKSSLAREVGSLETFERFLPSLDLKRQQLMVERAEAARAVAQGHAEIEAFRALVGRKLPMLANQDVDLTDLAKLTKVVLGSENLVGTLLPTLERIEVEIRPYALLAKPHWVDSVAGMVRDMMELRIRIQVAERRLALLETAVKTITQRVNLFDKVLIPRTKANIKKIRIYLSDGEMSAVVRSKIAKGKRAGGRAT